MNAANLINSNSITHPNETINKNDSEVLKSELAQESEATILVKEKNEVEKMRYENAKLDDFVCLGKYTIFVCMLSELLILCQLGNMLYMVYAGAAPSLVSCGSKIFTPQETTPERCNYMDTLKNSTSLSSTISEACQPQFQVQFESVNSEFGYYCAGTKIVKQTISIQMIGVMIGSVVFGNLSDSYGRRKIMIIALILCLFCMLVTSFTMSLFWFTFWRFLVNIFNGGTMVILMVFMVENLPKKDRFWISNLITWSPNMVVFAILAYLTGDWRTLSRVSALLALPAVGLLFFLCESPRFLVHNRNIEQAKAAIMRIHKIDGRQIDEPLLDYVLNKEEQIFLESTKKKKYNFLHLFYTTTFSRYTIAVAFSFLVTSILNYSLLFNMEKLSGSIYWNSIFMGCFRYACNLFIVLLDVKFQTLGRKFVHFFAQTFASIALAFVSVVYAFGLHAELSNLMRVAVLSVIGVCSLLYTANGIVSNELFPTCIRNTSYSFGQVLSRLGVVLSPQIFLLNEIWLPLPYFVMLGLSLIDLLFFQLNVIETKGKPLSDNMPDKSQRWFNSDNKNIELLPRTKEKVPAQQINDKA